MRATGLLLCTMLLGATLPVARAQTTLADITNALRTAAKTSQQRPSAGEIDPLPLLLFSAAGYGSILAAANATKDNGDRPPTVGSFFEDAQKEAARRLDELSKEIGAYGQRWAKDFASVVNVAKPNGTKVRDATGNDGAVSITNLCGLYNAYKQKPTIVAELSPDASVNDLFATVCATIPTAKSAEQRSALANWGLKTAVDVSVANVKNAIDSQKGSSPSTGSGALASLLSAANAPAVAARSGPSDTASGGLAIGNGQLAKLAGQQIASLAQAGLAGQGQP